MARRVGFIGSGNMAEALAKGILAGGLCRASELLGSDVSEERRADFTRATGVETTADNGRVVRECGTVVLSVKPQHLDGVLREAGPLLGPSRLVVSIVAGASTARIESFLPKGARVVRAMPNTPMLVRRGVAALARGACATEGDLAEAERILRTGAEVLRFDERMLDPATALSGSGPGYVFYFMEAMIEAGTALGFSPEEAARMVASTFAGSARLLEETKETPEALRRKVASPGGTTEAGLAAMESKGLKRIIVEGILAANQRARLIGNPKS